MGLGAQEGSVMPVQNRRSAAFQPALNERAGCVITAVITDVLLQLLNASGVIKELARAPLGLYFSPLSPLGCFTCLGM